MKKINGIPVNTLNGAFMNHGELKSGLSSTIRMESCDIVCLQHPLLGELHLRIHDNGQIECFASDKFKLETENMIGRYIKVEHFGTPE